MEEMDRIERLERGRILSKSANNYSPLRNEVQGGRVAWHPLDDPRAHPDISKQYSFGRDNYVRE